MNFFKLIVKRLLVSPLYLLSYIIPRNQKIWVIGSYGGGYNDNSKYFFIYLNENKDKLGITPIWISNNSLTVFDLRNKRYKAYKKWSLLGVSYSLIAKVYIYSAYVGDINTWTSGNAIKINLWHGIPLKKIEFDIKKGILAPIFNGGLLSRIKYFVHYIRPDFVLSTSNKTSELFASSFRVHKSQCLPFGYPRNTLLVSSEEDVWDFINKYEPLYTKEIVNKINGFSRVYVYMPTWRDSGDDFFSKAFPDLVKLNKKLRLENGLLIIKAHAATIVEKNDTSYSNIIFFENNADIYPILALSDCLITDYSSILFDYMLSGKEIIFYAFDESSYLNGREMYFSYHELLTGQLIIKTFEELLLLIGRAQPNKMIGQDLNDLIGKEKGCPNEKIVKTIKSRI